jgi:GNAT superfamily N-acetyltransferase
MRRNTPGIIPVLLLGRLAVDHRHQGRGLGASLVKDCLGRCAALAAQVGFMGIVAHPANQAARDFWLHMGWVPMDGADHLLILPASQLGAGL